jgi:hypothetical protein
VSKLVCTSCGYVGEPTTVTKGSSAIELILWLCLLVPGLIYSIWRLSSRHDACPTCSHTTLIPVESAMGKKFLRENLPEQFAIIVEQDRQAEERNRQSRRASHSAGMFFGRLVRRLFK